MKFLHLSVVFYVAVQSGVCVTAADVFHNASNLFYVNPIAGEVKLRGTVGTITDAYVIIDSVRYPMQREYSGKYDYFVARAPAFDTTTTYAFVIADTADSIRLPETGTYVPQTPVFITPQWAQGNTYYSIFTDCFYNADKNNDPRGRVNWGTTPRAWSPYGGDLRGILEKIDNLDSLAPDIILLQPIVPASSNHKLNAREYTAIDTSFGTSSDLQELIDSLHERNMKVIMSMVCTHTGTDFPAFADITENGATSQYLDWYHVTSLPIKPDPPSYECWRTDHRFPKLNLSNARVRNYLVNALDYWVEFGFDGFYIGIDKQIDAGFVAALNTRLKEKNPELVLLGSDHSLVTGTGFDGVTLNDLTELIKNYFVHKSITTSMFDQELKRILFFSPPQVVNLNLTTVSDYTTRIASMAQPRMMKNLYAFIFTYVGSPVILFGDEIGMHDCVPYNPGSFSWEPENQDRELLAEIKNLISIRRNNEQIRGTAFFTLYINDITQVYAYDRGGLIVVLNSSNKTAFVELPAWDGSYQDLISEEILTAYAQTLRLSVDAFSYRILKREL